MLLASYACKKSYLDVWFLITLKLNFQLDVEILVYLFINAWIFLKQVNILIAEIITYRFMFGTLVLCK